MAEEQRPTSPDSDYIYWFIYFLLVAFRLSSSFHMHSGYIHPDEFFQSVELAAGDIYPGLCSLRTWEFRNEDPGPVRSPTAIWPFAHLPISLYKWWLPPHTHNTTGDEWVTRMLFPTRLLTSAVSFIPDCFIVWLNSQSIEKTKAHKLAALLVYDSMAYGGLVYGARTFTNVWELSMVCIFIFLSTRNGLGYLVCQAALSSWALFLRPTFAVFAAPFVLHQIVRLFRQSRWKRNFQVHIPVGLLVAASVAGFLIISDTKYFDKHNGDWVATPLRFVRYNTDVNTLKEHGLHPWFDYLIIHWPLILTPPVAIAAFIPTHPSGSLKFTCWSSLVLSTIALSIIPHKETRFLLPLVPLAVVLGINNLSIIFTNRKYRHLLYCCLVLWVIIQATLTIFWGFAHQGGLIPMMRSLPANSGREIETLKIFHSTYMPPRFPFGITAEDDKKSLSHLACFRNDLSISTCPSVIDLGGQSHSDFMVILRCLKAQGTQRIILTVPGSHAPSKTELSEVGLLLRTEKKFPHISTEYFPSLKFPNCPLNMHIFHCLGMYWTDFKSQLSLHSYFIWLS